MKSVCTWKFALRNYKILDDATDVEKCDTCWGAHTAKMRENTKRKREADKIEEAMLAIKEAEPNDSGSEPEHGWGNLG